MVHAVACMIKHEIQIIHVGYTCMYIFVGHTYMYVSVPPLLSGPASNKWILSSRGLLLQTELHTVADEYTVLQ